MRLALAALSILLAASGVRAADIRLDMSSTTNPGIMISGPIVEGDAARFYELAVTAPQNIVVTLDSPGGKVIQAIGIGNTLHRHGWATYVPRHAMCASACAFIWAAGTKRMAAASAHIGFHSAFDIVNGTRLTSGSANALLGAYLAQLGFSPPAIVYMTAADPSRMTWIDSMAMGKAGFDYVVTESPWVASTASPAAPLILAGAVPPAPALEAANIAIRARPYRPNIAQLAKLLEQPRDLRPVKVEPGLPSISNPFPSPKFVKSVIVHRDGTLTPYIPATPPE